MIKILRVVVASGVAAAMLATAPPAAANTYCGESSRGIAVYAGNSQTSCGFALNVAEAYASYGNGSQPFSVSSPATGLSYTMTCTGAGSVCQGGNNAVVYLR
jgi:hypothetical protein